MSAPFEVVCRHYGDYLGQPEHRMPAFEQGAGNAKDPERNVWHHRFQCPTCGTEERVSGHDLFRLGYWRIQWGLADIPLVGFQFLLERMRHAERAARATGNERLE